MQGEEQFAFCWSRSMRTKTFKRLQRSEELELTFGYGGFTIRSESGMPNKWSYRAAPRMTMTPMF